MAYYEPSGWQAPPPVMRQVSWDKTVSPGTMVSQYQDPMAFVSQFEEVDRAIDNLMKSGKLASNFHRRDSMPLLLPARPYDIAQDPRFPTSHRHSIAGIDGLRHPRSLAPPPGTSYHGYPPPQPYPRTASTDSNQIFQAKRMAAQRERDFRSHQLSQQYHRGQPLYVNDPPYFAVSTPASSVDEYHVASPVYQQYPTAPSSSVPASMSIPLTVAPTNASRGATSVQSARTASGTATPAPVLIPGNRTNPTSPTATSPYGSLFGDPASLASATSPSAYMSMPFSGPSPIGSSRPAPNNPQTNRTPSNATSNTSTSNATNTPAPPAYYQTENPEQTRSQSHLSSQSQQHYHQTSQIPLSQLPQLPSQQRPQITTDNLSIHSTPPLASPVGSSTHRTISNQSPSASSMLETSTKGSSAAGIGGSSAGSGLGLGGWTTNSGVWSSKKAFGVQASVWG